LNAIFNRTAKEHSFEVSELLFWDLVESFNEENFLLEDLGTGVDERHNVYE